MFLQQFVFFFLLLYHHLKLILKSLQLLNTLYFPFLSRLCEFPTSLMPNPVWFENLQYVCEFDYTKTITQTLSYPMNPLDPTITGYHRGSPLYYILCGVVQFGNLTSFVISPKTWVQKIKDLRTSFVLFVRSRWVSHRLNAFANVNVDEFPHSRIGPEQKLRNTVFGTTQGF